MSKEGMNELQHIVLNLYRDVERVKKAISPKVADDIVAKHNEKYLDKPEKHFVLKKF